MSPSPPVSILRTSSSPPSRRPRRHVRFASEPITILFTAPPPLPVTSSVTVFPNAHPSSSSSSSSSRATRATSSRRPRRDLPLVDASSSSSSRTKSGLARRNSYSNTYPSNSTSSPSYASQRHSHRTTSHAYANSTSNAIQQQTHALRQRQQRRRHSLTTVGTRATATATASALSASGYDNDEGLEKENDKKLGNSTLEDVDARRVPPAAKPRSKSSTKKTKTKPARPSPAPVTDVIATTEPSQITAYISNPPTVPSSISTSVTDASVSDTGTVTDYPTTADHPNTTNSNSDFSSTGLVPYNVTPALEVDGGQVGCFESHKHTHRDGHQDSGGSDGRDQSRSSRILAKVPVGGTSECECSPLPADGGGDEMRAVCKAVYKAAGCKRVVLCTGSNWLPLSAADGEMRLSPEMFSVVPVGALSQCLATEWVGEDGKNKSGQGRDFGVCANWPHCKGIHGAMLLTLIARAFNVSVRVAARYRGAEAVHAVITAVRLRRALVSQRRLQREQQAAAEGEGNGKAVFEEHEVEIGAGYEGVESAYQQLAGTRYGPDGAHDASGVASKKAKAKDKRRGAVKDRAASEYAAVGQDGHSGKYCAAAVAVRYAACTA